MKTYLIDYYFLNDKRQRENEFYETIEIEAENNDDAEKELFRSLGDVEIASIFCEEN